MAVSPYFRETNSPTEFLLYEDLLIESIKINGIDVYYLPRTLVNVDTIFKEDPLSIYQRAHLIEMYPLNVTGYGGPGDLLGKFGIENRDTAGFVLARRRFMEEIGYYRNLVRPLEGDLIYWPSAKHFFEIRYVKNIRPFYQFGEPDAFELSCDKMEYSHERLDTGVPMIDIFQANNNTANTGAINITTDNDEAMVTEQGDQLLIENNPIEQNDKNAQNTVFEQEADRIIDFTERNPFGNL